MAHLSLLLTPTPEILLTLQKSDFRKKFRLTNDLRAYAQKLGENGLKTHAKDILQKRLVPEAKANDGKQTPMKGHPIFVAQHACALCCRGCVQKWYGIDPSRALTREETERAIELLTTWIREDLKRTPKPIRRTSFEVRQASFDF